MHSFPISGQASVQLGDCGQHWPGPTDLLEDSSLSSLVDTGHTKPQPWGQHEALQDV